MPVDADKLERLLEIELQTLRDERVSSRIRLLLVDPAPVMRAWDYGPAGTEYPCWTVLQHPRSGTEIAFCEEGFGPARPWGLVWTSAEEPRHQSIGQDSGWFSSFLDAFFDSFAAAELPIWRVFKQPSAAEVMASPTDWLGEPLTVEGSWEAGWRDVEELRKANPGGRYICHHSIAYGAAAPPTIM